MPGFAATIRFCEPDRPSRSFNLHNLMAREKRPLGRKCPARRERITVRAFGRYGMLGKRREGGIRMRGRREEWKRRAPGRVGGDGRGCEEKEEARGKMKWRKDKEEREIERERGWLASAKTRPLYHQQRIAGGIDKRFFLTSFLSQPFFLPLFFSPDEIYDVHEWCMQGRFNPFEASYKLDNI